MRQFTRGILATNTVLNGQQSKCLHIEKINPKLAVAILEILAGKLTDLINPFSLDTVRMLYASKAFQACEFA